MNVMLENRPIVVNSLFWFVFNRMDITTTEALLKATTEFYSDKEIEDAKDILYQYLHPERKKIRKGLRYDLIRDISQ